MTCDFGHILPHAESAELNPGENSRFPPRILSFVIPAFRARSGDEGSFAFYVFDTQECNCGPGVVVSKWTSSACGVERGISQPCNKRKREQDPWMCRE